MKQWLAGALGLAAGQSPFPWQEELLTRFANGTIERSLDIPTGLGKTAVMAIWLVARATGAALPRRLVYVVDRRAVVDQATDVAKRLREFVEKNAEFKRGLGLDRSLPISTLRGQYADNREWLEDPASPAIIVGTVDMVGSRLLFEGYGTSRKMRPYLAGLLGADTLLVLDEAHLVPPFEKLLETVADGTDTFGPCEEALRQIVPPFKLLSLSATGRPLAGTPFGLGEADLEHSVLRQRLIATKRLVMQPIDNPKKLTDTLAELTWRLAGNGTRAVRCIVFCDKRKDATAVKAAIDKFLNGDRKRGVPEVNEQTQLFVGGRRVFEREKAAEWLEARGFIAGTKIEQTRPAFVFATSAGEVGVDLDADHMVSDLVAWERMVQRLGRVNRRGDGDAQVMVVIEPSSSEVEEARKKPQEDRTPKELMAIADADQNGAVRQVVERLPHEGDAWDVSLRALRALKISAQSDSALRTLLDAATTPAPLRPALSRALVDGWSMTSLEEHTGRPKIDPWLRGWVENEGPQTAVVWRTHLPLRRNGAVTTKEIEAFFEAAPPHASELLETETFHVIEWLAKRTKRLKQRAVARENADESGHYLFREDDVVAIGLTRAGDCPRTLRIADFALDNSTDAKRAKKMKEILEGQVMGVTLVIDARFGGLKDGLLDSEWDDLPRTVDDGAAWISAAADTSQTAPTSIVGFRVRSIDVARGVERDGDWKECFRFVTETSEAGDPTRWLVVDNAASEEPRSMGRPQLVDEHQAWAEQRARHLAQRLRLPDPHIEMLALTASLHDEGKRTKRWQRAFNARRDGREYAKTRGPINYALLDGYRHEFGSLPILAKDARFASLPSDLQDLALHLIAAHHGFARPVIRVSGCEDSPPSVLEDRARDVALRFARLQKRWGPWGLAWWEALLRAADQQASRQNDATDLAGSKAKANG